MHFVLKKLARKIHKEPETCSPLWGNTVANSGLIVDLDFEIVLDHFTVIFDTKARTEEELQQSLDYFTWSKRRREIHW